MSATQISKATLQDVPQLVPLVNSAYRGEGPKKGWTTEADLLDGIRIDAISLTDLVNAAGSYLLKYEDERGYIRGCVHLQKQKDKMYLGMLTVSPEAQASGIGKQLLQAGENFARELGFNRIVMTVISIRHELIAWYQRHGYEPTGVSKPFPNDPRFGIPRQPLEFIVLEKSLS